MAAFKNAPLPGPFYGFGCTSETGSNTCFAADGFFSARITSPRPAAGLCVIERPLPLLLRKASKLLIIYTLAVIPCEYATSRVQATEQ